MLLSAFFWGYITTQLVGGIAARKFGPKAIMSFCIVVPSFFTLLIPVVARQSVALFVICRVLTGVAAGVCYLEGKCEKMRRNNEILK
jgi:MFS family permease